MNGLQVTAKLRERLHRQIPVIILTGDISTDTLREIALQDCVWLNKPVKSKELAQVIQRLLPISQSAAHPHAPHPAKAASSPEPPVIFVIDDDSHVREGIRAVLEEAGQTVEDYPTCEAFLEAYRPGREACLVIDAYLPGMTGLELLQQLHDAGHRLPAIMITGNADVSMAVQAMKAGASDFIEKPIGPTELVASVERALEQSRDSNKLFAWRETAANHIAGLTARQRQIMELVLAGHPNKNYRRGSRHQPTHCREPSRLDHEENRLEVSSGVGPLGACRRRGIVRTSACSTRLLGTALRRGCAGGGWLAFEYPFKPYGDHGADDWACDVDPGCAHVAAEQIGGE